MKLHKKSILLFLFLFFAAESFAQNAVSNTDQNNFMTSDGKILVVMAVVVVIVLGLFLYLFNLDKKITKLEKNSKQ